MNYRTLAAAALLITAPALPAQEEEAIAWIEKLASLSGKSYECDMKMNMSLDAMETSMSMGGHMVYGDTTHMAMKLKMDIESPQAPEPMNMDMNMVLDGTTMWMAMEMPNPMDPAQRMNQVFKLPIARMKDLGESGMGMGSIGPFSMTDMNPVDRAKEFFDFYTDVSVTRADGLVTIEGGVNEEKMDELMGGQSLPLDITRLAMVIDENLAFPVQMQMGDDEKMFMTMSFANVRFVDEMDPAKFTYTAPEGVAVMDLGMMIPAAASAEDDEY